MKLCRYDEDCLGVVRGDLVHDISEAQTEIRNAAPYAMLGDAVVAALPAWRERFERLADRSPGHADRARLNSFLRSRGRQNSPARRPITKRISPR